MMTYRSPMDQMSKTTPTQFWNDSCSIPEMTYAIEHGAVGATTNPVIVGQVLKGDMDAYIPTIKKLVRDNPHATEDEIAWLLNEHMAVQGAKLLRPIFERNERKNGYISIQTNTKYYRTAEKLVEQALHFSTLADNMMIKLPVTAAGVAAIEELTYRGVNLNATVSFTVPQAIAVAEAIERALDRREREGLGNAALHPVCTIMVGRIEDWLREVAKSENITVDPHSIDMSGVAVFKNAYKIFRERGYRTRLLSAAYRNHYHWSEFIGGDVSMTIPSAWIWRFNYCDIPVENRMDNPVSERVLDQLRRHFKDFNRAYEPDGLSVEEFDSFGATRRTLMQFLNGYDEMVAVVRGIMVNG